MAITTRPPSTRADGDLLRAAESGDAETLTASVDRHDEPVPRALDGNRPRAGTPVAPETTEGPDR